MKAKSIIYLFIVLLMLKSIAVFGKSDETSIVVKIGRAEYNSSIGSFAGGGPGYKYWKLGPQITLGIERELNSSFNYQVIFLYSIHSFDPKYAWGKKVDDAYNSLYDLMANLKFKLGYFYVIAGAGFSYQVGDEVNYSDANLYQERLYPPKTEFRFAGILGIGLEVNINTNFSVFAEPLIHMREYMGSSVSIGCSYKLN